MGFIYKKLINMTLVASSLSYWICLFIAMICVFIGMAGSSKAKTGIMQKTQAEAKRKY